MSLPAEEFLKELADSGLLNSSDLPSLGAGSPDAAPSGEQLAEQLVESGQLTPYQAETLLKGEGRTLVLGNYVVLDRIGAGGMGVVLKAMHRRMKRLVALKLLPGSATDSEESLRRFHREVEAAARLSHPNIVTAYDADEAKGVHFYVMEHVDGGDLSSLVKQRGPLPVDVVVDCVLQAARGLAYAHSQGIIHRDIKPANLLMNRQGVVQILDMGLARIDAGEGDDQAELTGTGSIMGTLDYMSPEQALDTKHAGRSTDIYSLGATLHYLLTARPVISGRTQGEKMRALLTEDTRQPASLTAHRQDIPPELEQVFQRMVARDPQQRYSSMEEVVAALEMFVPARQSSATGSTVSERSDSSGGTMLGSGVSDEALQRFLDAQPLSTTMIHSPELDVSAETFHSSVGGPTQVSGGSTEEAPLTPSALVRRRQQQQRRTTFKWIFGAILFGAAVLSVPLLLKVDTSIGTIVLKIHQDAALGAEVTVDDEQITTIKTGNGTQMIRIEPSEEERLLKVSKDGFESFTSRFVLKEGGRTIIEVWLLPEEVPRPGSTPTPVADAPDRALARWVLLKGGVVRLDDMTGGPGVDIGRFDDMPADDVPLRVSSVSFRDVAAITDEDVAELARLWSNCAQTSLQGLDLPGTGITDAAVEALAGTTINRLDLSGTAITDAGAAGLRDIHSLERLTLYDTAVTDAACGSLSEIDSLTYLVLDQTQITDEGAAKLAELPNLDWFQIIGNDDIGDATLQRMCAHPTVQSVLVGETRVTDAGLEAVIDSGLKHLEILGCQGVTERGLASLGRALSLVSLNLSGIRSVSDAGLAQLAALKDLTLLDVHATPITDASLDTLNQFQKLTLLRLKSTGLSPEGIQRLHEALPNCRIEWNGGTIEAVARWQSGPAEGALIGIVPRPAVLAGIKRWQVETTTPRGFVKCADFTRDGQVLACGTQIGHIRLLDADTLELLSLWPGTRMVTDLEWSPDGLHLAVCEPGRAVSIYNREGVLQQQTDARAHRSFAWDPAGGRLAIGGNTDRQVHLYSLDTEQSVVIGEGPSEGAPVELAWSPDGQWIATGWSGGELRLWQTEGTAGPDLTDFDTRITSLAWSPDSQQLAAVAGNDVRLWSSDGTLIRQLQDLPSQPAHLAWAPDNQTLLIAGAVQTLRWDTRTDTASDLPRLSHDDDYTTALLWRPGSEGEFARCDTFGAVDLIRADGELRASTGRSWALADGLELSPQGDRLATANWDGSVRVWDRQGHNVASQRAHGNLAFDVAWNADGSSFATSGADNTVRTWTADGESDRVLRTDGDQHLYAVDWDPRAGVLAARGKDPLVRMWAGNESQPRELPAVRAAEQWISLRYSPDGRYLAADAPQGAWIWTRDRSGAFLANPMLLEAGMPGRVAWRPDSQAIALANDVNVKILQLDGTELAAFRTTGSTGDLVWSPAGDALAFSGSDEDRVNVYTSEGTLLRTLTGLTTNTSGIDWSADGDLIVAGESACTVQAWDAGTGESLWVGLQLPDLENVSFTAAGQIIDGDIEVLDRRLICLVEHDDGRIELVKPSEFQARYAPDWRVGTESTSSPSIVNYDHERAVAEWVHQQGGSLGITHPQQGYLTVRPDDELPDDSFALVVLDLTGWAITDDDLARLDRLPRFTTLVIHGVAIGDEGIARLGDLPALQKIYIGGTNVSDAGLAQLCERYPGIEILHAGGTGITDAGIASLLKWPGLFQLHIGGLPLTDAAVDTLVQLQNLRELRVVETKITEEGITRLREALPHCKIEWNGGTIGPVKEGEAP